jgi:hypothetical protein
MIVQTIQTKLVEAMKAHDENVVGTLRLLISAFNYEQIAKQHELTEEEELAVIRKEVKQRRDSIEAYDKAGRTDLSEKEKVELDILATYLPPEMSDEEIVNLVDQAIIATGAKTMSEMGMVIGKVKSAAPGADGARIAQLVREKLS